jgi:TonB family C-terminal domain
MSPSRRAGRHAVMPTYPIAARRAGTEGTVTIVAHLDSSGLLCSATVIDPRKPSRTLATAALDAAVRSQFDPAVRNGQPVESLRLLVFNFVLTD